jgi:hypothetical protein
MYFNFIKVNVKIMVSALTVPTPTERMAIRDVLATLLIIHNATWESWLAYRAFSRPRELE